MNIYQQVVRHLVTHACICCTLCKLQQLIGPVSQVSSVNKLRWCFALHRTADASGMPTVVILKTELCQHKNVLLCFGCFCCRLILVRWCGRSLVETEQCLVGHWRQYLSWVAMSAIYYSTGFFHSSETVAVSCAWILAVVDSVVLCKSA